MSRTLCRTLSRTSVRTSVRTMPRPIVVRLIPAALALAGLAACGRGANQSADRNGADTTSADSSMLGTPVGADKPAMDSGFAAGQQRLDSLRAAGVGPNNGLDSAAWKVNAATRNEPGADTSRLSNQATPGGVSPSGQRP